jgi:hypothetical protein
MGDNTSGFENEDELIEYLNSKKIKDLNSNMKDFIFFIFGNIDEENIIQATSGKSGQKPDMIITINNVIKRISIKKGTGNSVHQEKVDVFVEFLESINISNETINKLLKFHWGDGTSDGTGSQRISSSDYKQQFPEEIEMINKEFNKEKNIKEFIYRFIMQGKSDDYDIVDALYYGNVNEGHWASKDEIIEYVVNNIFSLDSIHFGPLTYQIWNRCLNFNPNTENRRRVMQVKWGSLLNDLLIIERNRKNE